MSRPKSLYLPNSEKILDLRRLPFANKRIVNSLYKSVDDNYKLSIDKYLEMVELTKELLNLVYEQNVRLPEQYKESIININKVLVNVALSILPEELPTELLGKSEIPINIKFGDFSNIANTINSIYSEQMLISSSERSSLKLFELYSFVKASYNIIDHFALQKLRTTYTEAINDSIATKTKLDNILESAKKSTAEKNISNFAQVYGDKANDNKTFALAWLITGLVMIFCFILFLSLSSINNWFPSEVTATIKEIPNSFVRYNYGNLFTKAMLVAISVFFITFCFKQFSIQRHLQTINQHRSDTLNSYDLYKLSMSSNISEETKDELLGHIAKTIYDHQPTGFISEKTQNVNSGIFELTKNIVGNNPTKS
ncbi:hypothetical protein [Carboxylicivirga sp. RSCT41]|uniref:hypothetical protein n=1 Tax=Carboxylicivirga agarovorans TaxID=3417570 RepID=UPI003D3371FD